MDLNTHLHLGAWVGLGLPMGAQVGARLAVYDGDVMKNCSSYGAHGAGHGPRWFALQVLLCCESYGS